MVRWTGSKAAIASIGDPILEDPATEAASSEAASTEAASTETTNTEAASTVAASSIASTEVTASTVADAYTSHNCSLVGASFSALDKGRTISLCLRRQEG
jgi:hypothetical protein